MTRGLTPKVPDQPSIDGLEAVWTKAWDEEATYRFDPDTKREDVFSIDTPPPTVSGSLHIGHVFSYTHTDVLARFQRMRGKNVFYPMGWDDNGLATERRVENYFGVRCDPSLPYEKNYEAPDIPGETKQPVSRRNFVELCERLTATDELVFKEIWRRLGISIDWSLEYATVSRSTQAISQRGFLSLAEKGHIYSALAPTLWDIDFRTAVSQAELEDRERPGATHRVAFAKPDGTSVVVETTRPELIPSCVALVAHPDDERYQDLFGTFVHTPLFGVKVPVKAHELAAVDKGTGIAMVCTFGDLTDVTWWRELELDTRTLIGRDGRFQPADFTEFPSRHPEVANAIYAEIEGASVNQARATVVEALRTSGDLIGDPSPITHPVKFYEKGERPLEIVASRQWFVNTLAHRAELLQRGEEIAWHPDYMRHRYASWVEGLNVDWNISRQRYFGVPFPVWYPLNENAEPDFDAPIYASEASLPVDPASDVPPGYESSQRGQPHGFMGDPDIMDTWATSSLTPQIAGHWGSDLFDKVFPMDLRPQAHEIIRTWLFSTVVRSHFEFGQLPWAHAIISGWILDPDRKKMSKSKGNVVTPMPLLEKHGADALRYWAASGRPGADTAIDEAQMKIGRRLAIKMLNVAKFVLGRLEGHELGGLEDVAEAIDRDFVGQLGRLVEEATTALDNYDWARALERTEALFWSFCDDYVELVKTRAYDAEGEAAKSARATLGLALSVFTRLLAPVLPYASEETWRWWHEDSVHRSSWPNLDELAVGETSPVYGPVCEVLEAIRRAKSAAKVSQRAGVAVCAIDAPSDIIEALRAGLDDLKGAGSVASFEFAEAPELSVSVELAPPASA